MVNFSIKTFLITLFVFFLSPTAFAGICDLSGSGIGGTGAPILQNQGSGIGGTGAPALKSSGSGIGGTGAPISKNTGSGLGGTGAIANGSGIGGTGQKTDNQASIIIGTITGFGSICVNGVEIHYSSSTPVQVNGEPANTEQLAIGQMVSVTVSGTGIEVIAQDIHVMNVVVGPITEVDPHLNRVKVLGQQIQLSEKTHVSSDNTGTAKLQKGDFVQVSGLRQPSGQIIASRIDRPITHNRVHLSGAATHITAHGFMIAGTRIDTPISSTIKEGQEVSVTGKISTDKIIAQQITIPTIADNQRFKLEGFAHIDTNEDGNIQIKIGPLAIEANEQIKERLLTLNPEQSIIIDGTKEADHTIIIEHLFIKDDIEHTDNQDISHIKTRNFKELGEKYNEHKETPEHIQNHNLDKETEVSESPEVKSVEIEIPEEEESSEAEEHEIETPEVEGPEIEAPEVEVPEIEAPEVEVPEIEAPEVEVPEIETPEVEVPEIETPEIEVPEIETPEVEVPEIEVPEIETPEIEVPEIEAPEVEVPEIETPEIEVPEIEAPEVEVPEIEVPEIETPEIEVPEIEAPEVEVPEIEAPEVEVPEIETPEIEVPEIETPEIEVPEIEAPEVEVPEVEVPEVEVPEIETPEIEENE